MKFTSSIGMICLAIYLILIGLIALLGLSLGALSIVIPILAVVAGILILIGR